MPQIMFPPVISFSVANALAVTIGSRVTGFVTIVPYCISGFATWATSQPRSVHQSCQMTWESKHQS